MARPLRITFPGAFYHITSRGNERKEIFKSNEDRKKFLEYLECATERYNALIHAYCLMDNHYHLILETPSANMPQIMRHINGAYTTYFNLKHKRVGHLFQGRYKAIVVNLDEYAKVLSRYIHLNPVRAGIIENPEAYPWSSYPFYIGKNNAPEWLHKNFILVYFGKKESVAQKKYHAFVNGLLGKEYESPLKDVVSSTLLGNADFIQYIKENFLSDNKPNKDLPALKELAPKASVQDIFQVTNDSFGSNTKLSRNIKMYLCQKYTGEKLKNIGKHFGISESGVSQACCRVSKWMEKDTILRDKIEKLVERINPSRMKT